MKEQFIDRGKRSTKEGFALGLLKSAEKNPQIFGIGSDITSSVGMDLFAKNFPERFISLGIAEQNAAAVSAGLALMNKIPVFSSYAVFSTFRAADQIRVSICYNNLKVIIGGAHAGLSVGPDGATHQALEDIALMRVLPNMTVLSPCDATQTEKILLAAIENINGPIYIRYGREAIPDFSTEEIDFEIGKAQILKNGYDVCIVATGLMTWESLCAAEFLNEQGINARVINVHTIKPFDEELIVKAANECKAIVVCEEHQISGGLGGIVAETLAKNYPCPIEFVGINDTFGESGKADELLLKYKIDRLSIVDAVLKVINRKNV